MKVLYVTPYVPSRIRTRPYHLIRELLRLGHRVTTVTAASTSPEEIEQAQELAAWGSHVRAFPVSRLRSLKNCLLALPTREPLQAAYAYHPRMERQIRDLLVDGTYDVVHIEHLRAARLIRAVLKIPVVYDAVDSISLLFEQTALANPNWQSRLKAILDLDRTRRYEANLLLHCDQVAVTSRRDQQAFQDLAQRYAPLEMHRAPITVIVNGVDTEYFSPQDTAPRDRETLVFTGKMSYHANSAAALYFAREVLPLIWARNPDVRFQIVGKDPPSEVQQLATDRRIEVTGYVEDLRPYLARAAISICPVLYAVGVQNKVLEAMAMATPVVSSSAGCAAIDVESGRELIIADGLQSMADAVLQVLSAPSLAQRLGVGGRSYVETHHSWTASAQRFVELYEQARDRIHD
jgi:sugar transferase (PEP-CTERM/EpsH1 system associated)